MTQQWILKTARVVSISSVMWAAATLDAAANTAEPVVTVAPAAVYHASRGLPLETALAQIAQRSGIRFSINSDVSQDRVSQTVAAADWSSAVRSVLAQYNTTYTEHDGRIDSVIVMGRVAPGSQAAVTAASEWVTIERRVQALPKRYRDLPAGTVSPVNLPMTQLLAQSAPNRVTLDLPMGQFAVSHENTVDEADGSKTWVGYLENEGRGYRVFLSQGAAGTMGFLSTPDGNYQLESDADGTYLVDTRQLASAGFDNDTPAPTPQVMAAVALQATQSEITALQTAVDTAFKAVTAAKTAADQAAVAVNLQSKVYGNAATAYSAAVKQQLTATNAVAAAQKTYNANKSAANNTALSAAKTALTNAQAATTAAKAVVDQASSQLTALRTVLSQKQTAYTTAYQNYTSATKALAAAKAAPVTSTTTGTNTPSTSTGTGTTPVVDLMVVYTTTSQTADFAKQRISLLTTVTNQAYKDSGIAMQLRLVATEATAYVETNSNDKALSDLASGAGAFAGISQKRIQNGADLVFFFRPLYANTSGSCGVTYLEFGGGSQPNKAYGYGVISDGRSKDSASTYYCGENTYAHEIGHSLGLVHDREYSNVRGVFNYAYAWGVQGTFATIMSYKSPMLMYFSTPTLSNQCKGQPCGYAASDSARSSDQTQAVNYTAPIVANFMPTVLAAPLLK